MNKERLYVIKLGKMYLKTIDLSEYDSETEFIYNIEFTSDKTEVYLKSDEDNCNEIINKLERILNIFIEDIFEIEEVQNEERE